MRLSRDDGYNRSSRFYDTPAGVFPSVTTVLGVVAKPALVPWAAKQERIAVVEAAAGLWEDTRDVPVEKRMSRAAYLTTLDLRIGRQKAHAKVTAKAMEIGSQAHALIEWNLRRDLAQKVGPEPKVTDKALWAFMAYEDWRRSANLSPMLVEQTVWSREYGYAGTLDWLGEVDGPDGSRLVVCGDWKSSKAIYPESFLQIAAYAHALAEMGHTGHRGPVGGCVVRLPKVETDPEFEVRILSPADLDRHFAAFLHALGLWRWQEAEAGREAPPSEGRRSAADRALDEDAAAVAAHARMLTGEA